MANPSLRDYLRSLDPAEICRIEGPIPRDFILTAMVANLEQRELFPVLWIEKTDRSDIPIVTNMFAKRERIIRLLGSGEAEFSQKWLDSERNKIPPRVVPCGEVQEVVHTGEQVDILPLPIMQHYDSDAGRYVTSAIIVAKDPQTGIRNLSYHRLQVKNPRKMGISLHSRAHLWTYFNTAERLNRSLEVAVVIGVHPLVMLAASAKTTIDVDEYDIAGGLLGEPLELVAGKTVGVEYPANAEIVLEGRILSHVYEDEGPFGEFTGYSTSRSTRNVLEISALCRRKNPLYLSVAAGASADHLNLARMAKETLVLNRLQERVPNVRRIFYPRSGVNLHCFVSLAPGPEGSARHALLLLFGLDPHLKLAIAVDEDIDITDEGAVMRAVATCLQGNEDIFMVPKVFTIRLDPSSIGGMSTKVGMDATKKAAFEAIPLKLEPRHAQEAHQILAQCHLEKLI